MSESSEDDVRFLPALVVEVVGVHPSHHYLGSRCKSNAVINVEVVLRC